MRRSPPRDSTAVRRRRPAPRSAARAGILLAVALLLPLSARLTAAAAPPAITITAPLPTLLQRGAAAFSAGRYAEAAAAFTEVERNFADDPAWRNGPLPQRLLPLRGFAQLRAGLADDAAESLGAFLDRFPDDAAQRGFVLYALALALRQAGQLDEARERFAAFAAEHPGTAQAALATFQRAEILFAQDRPDDALTLLQQLAGDATAPSLRVQARLRALQQAVELRRDALATQLLLGEPWEVSTMPEIAVLAFAAMEMGDRLMAAGHPRDALRAYRLVLPKARLVAAQRERLAELQARFDERAPAVGAGAGSFWVDFYRARLARIAAQLEGLEAAEDYTAPLQLRVGQAYLLAERHHEAWLACERLALDADAPEEVRREAHFRWILAAAGLERWEDALTIARDFVARHPEAGNLPATFTLIARAHLEQGRYAAAEEVYGDILARFPADPAAARARFTRGWVRAMQEKHADARDDFERYLDEHPEGPLAANAALWCALTFFFEHNYAEALTAFDALATALPATHPLRPEVLYRRGATLYAMRDFARARREMEAFVQDYAAHARAPEALVLLGDILMGAGELDAARARFAQVAPEATGSFVYGVFQTGKILRAQEDYAGMVEHFTAYTRRTDLPAQPRLSEALYWVGWAQQQLGHPDQALPVFTDVLQRFGDDPQAGEIGPTLLALESLHRRLGPNADFDAWLAAGRQEARTAGHLTYYARLTVFAADRHARRREPEQEEAMLLNLAGAVPPEALDAHGLARVGLVLQDIGSPEGRNHLQRLLDEFPESFERAAAFYGLAVAAMADGDFATASAWLERFDQETPTHGLAPQAAVLAGRARERAGAMAEAVARYENVLRLKSARGRPHAEALLGLARCYVALDQRDKAVGCYQRVYTMYRAYPDLDAEAYLRSAELFSQLGDAAAAAATYREMLALPQTGDAEQRATATRELAALEARLPAVNSETAEVAP